MALSDYLSGDEWDACFYAFFGKSQADNLGDSMRKTIEVLLASGYRFEGLDDRGYKSLQIEGTNNSQKFMQAFFGEDNGIILSDVIKNGRSFMKNNCPELISETDEEFNIAIASLKLHESES